VVVEAASATLGAKTVENLLNQWNSKLEAHVKVFRKQAKEISDRDREIIENGEKIRTLHHAVTDVQKDQKEIENTLTYIDSQQKDLDGMLDSLEKNIQDVLMFFNFDTYLLFFYFSLSKSTGSMASPPPRPTKSANKCTWFD